MMPPPNQVERAERMPSRAGGSQQRESADEGGHREGGYHQDGGQPLPGQVGPGNEPGAGAADDQGGRCDGAGQSPGVGRQFQQSRHGHGGDRRRSPVRRQVPPEGRRRVASPPRPAPTTRCWEAAPSGAEPGALPPSSRRRATRVPLRRPSRWPAPARCAGRRDLCPASVWSRWAGGLPPA